MNRAQKILSGVFAVQVALIVLIHTPFTDSSSATMDSRPLLEHGEDFVPVRLELGGAEGKELVASRQEDGWAIDSLDGFPADGAKIDKLLSDLGSIRLRRPMVSSRRHHGRFKVGDDTNEGHIRIWAEGGEVPALDLILGGTSNYRTTYARNGGEDAVYELRGLSPYDVRADAEAWIQKVLVGLPEEEVTGIVLRNPNGEFELTRESGEWTLVSPERPGAVVDAEKARELLRKILAVRISAPLGPSESENEPSATMTLRSVSAGGAAQEMEIWIGDVLEDDGNQRTISRSGFGYDGTVWNSSVSDLLERRVEELLIDSTGEESET